MSGPELDVVVVSYDTREMLLRCCRSALEASDGARVFVVDNASHDGSADAVRTAFPAVRVIEMDRNRGFAAAVNRGVRAGKSPLVLLLNSDAVIEADSLEKLCRALERDPRLGACGPQIRDHTGQLELSVGRTLGILNEGWFKFLGPLHRLGIWPVARILERCYTRARPVDSLSAACLLLRRQALEQVGGLDERFFLYAEDVDLCLRLRAAGWNLRYVSEAVVTHDRGASTRRTPLATDAAYRNSQLSFYRKHRGRASNLALRVWLIMRYSTRWLTSSGIRRRHARDMLRRILGGS